MGRRRRSLLSAKRARYLPAHQNAEKSGAALYRDNDELRYSLRSLEAYAPWVRTVFIATDEQVPAWLNTEHPKVRIVDHRDFIPHEYLPTFSSRPIEAHTHRIPDLAEHYLCLNDDFFLAAPCAKNFFFTPNGLPLLFTDWRASRREGYARASTPHACSYGNTRAYLEARLSPMPGFIAAHVPYVQTRTLASRAYAFYEKAVRVFACNKFRTRNEMAFWSHAIPLYACATGQAVPCDATYYYINTKRYDRRAHYAALLRQKGTDSQPLFFCLNDAGERFWPHSWREDMADFLQAYYPEPSTFERRGERKAVAERPGLE